jgi:hypothetical protein
MEDISILINDDPTIEDVDTEVNQFMQALLSNEAELDSLLELWGFWVDDVNRSSLMEGIRRQYNSPTQLIGKIFTLDVGSSPVRVRIKEITNNSVICDYLESYQGRVETFDISSFEYYSGIKLTN